MVTNFAGSSKPVQGAGFGDIFVGNFPSKASPDAPKLEAYVVTYTDDGPVTLHDGDRLPVGTHLIISARVRATQPKIPPVRTKMKVQIGDFAKENTFTISDSTGAGMALDHKYNNVATVKLAVHAQGEGNEHVDWGLTVYVQPDKVTIKDPVSGPTTLPTSKFTSVTVNTPVTVSGGLITSAPIFGPGAAGTISVPDLKGATAEAALQRLKSAGFTTKVQMYYMKSDLRNPRYGQVYEQSPAAGTRVAASTTFTLKVYGKP